MEREGLRRCLYKVLAQGIEITSKATDRCGLPDEEIDHQYDVWHMSKSSQKSQR